MSDNEDRATLAQTLVNEFLPLGICLHPRRTMVPPSDSSAPRSSAGFPRRMAGTRVRAALTAALVGVVTFLAMPASAVGQEWKCIAPRDCGPLVPTNGIVSFALRLESTPSIPGADVKVRIVSPDGVLFIGGQRMTPGSGGYIEAVTDARGVLSGYVQDGKAGQEIHLNAQLREHEFVTKTLRVAAPVTLSRAGRGFVRYAGTQSWNASVYADSVDPATCRQSVVRFVPRGGTGSVSIDSAFGKPEAGGVCVYSTDWRLGNEIGRQVLLARSGSAAPLEITAISRRRPSLRLGLAVAARLADLPLVETRLGDTIRIRRDIPGGFVEYDSVPRERTVKTERAWRVEPMPLILLDGPGPRLLGHDRIRISVGASATDFTRDFFLGIAVLQLFHGVQAEDSGFDFQVGALLSRPERLRNPALCRRDLLENRSEAVIKASCRNRDSLRAEGIAFTVSTDAQSLVGAVGKMLGFD